MERGDQRDSKVKVDGEKPCDTHTHTYTVSQLEWECGQLREQKDHHATEQRESSHYRRQQLQAEFDKKVGLEEGSWCCEGY